MVLIIIFISSSNSKNKILILLLVVFKNIVHLSSFYETSKKTFFNNSLYIIILVFVKLFLKCEITFYDYFDNICNLFWFSINYYLPRLATFLFHRIFHLHLTYFVFQSVWKNLLLILLYIMTKEDRYFFSIFFRYNFLVYIQF